MKRFHYLGVNINATNPAEAVALLRSYVPSKACYVCFPDSFVIKEAQRDKQLNSILNQSLLTLPDGKPSQWFANLSGYKGVKTVSGHLVLTELLNTNKTHYFYGGNPKELAQLEAAIYALNPKARVLGFNSPPMLALEDITTSEQLARDFSTINQLQPDCVWIGISSPKQDYLMHRATQELRGGILFGVGGVFNYVIHPHTKSPEWMKTLGLRWLYRAVKEPKRLGRKYMTMLGFLITRLPLLVVAAIRNRTARKS